MEGILSGLGSLGHAAGSALSEEAGTGTGMGIFKKIFSFLGSDRAEGAVKQRLTRHQLSRIDAAVSRNMERNPDIPGVAAQVSMGGKMQHVGAVPDNMSIVPYGGAPTPRMDPVGVPRTNYPPVNPPKPQAVMPPYVPPTDVGYSGPTNPTQKSFLRSLRGVDPLRVGIGGGLGVLALTQGKNAYDRLQYQDTAGSLLAGGLAAAAGVGAYNNRMLASAARNVIGAIRR